MKRMVIGVVVAVVSLATASAAQAQVEVDRGPVEFTLSSDACSRLPRGTTLEGAGRSKSVTRTSVDAATGLTTIINYTRARGRATDDDANRYRFDYRNSFHIVNSAAAPTVYTGTMFDVFAVTGAGPATLANGFVAVYTTDLGQLATFSPLLAWGDPIDFAAGTARCDPL